MDHRSVYSLDVFNHSNVGADSNVHLLLQMEEFILRFRLDNKFVYRYLTTVRYFWEHV